MTKTSREDITLLLGGFMQAEAVERWWDTVHPRDLQGLTPREAWERGYVLVVRLLAEEHHANHIRRITEGEANGTG